MPECKTTRGTECWQSAGFLGAIGMIQPVARGVDAMVKTSTLKISAKT